LFRMRQGNNVSSQISQPNRTRRGYLIVLAVIAVLVISFLGLVYSANISSGTRTVTTQQQFVTNLQETYSMQTITVTTNPFTITTSMAALPVTSSGSGSSFSSYPPYPQYQTCQYDCFYPSPGSNTLCQSTGANSTVQCWGYIYHNTSGWN